MERIGVPVEVSELFGFKGVHKGKIRSNIILHNAIPGLRPVRKHKEFFHKWRIYAVERIC